MLGLRWVRQTIGATAISDYKTPSAGVRRVGWFWPVGLAVLASASSSLIWFGLLMAYVAVIPNAGECDGVGAGYQLWSWIAFTVSVVLSLRLSFLAAGTLGINRLACVVITAILMLPLVLFFAVILLLVNVGICTD
jgi:hypothetical protein